MHLKQLAFLVLLATVTATKYFPVGLRANLENVLQEQADVIMVCAADVRKLPKFSNPAHSSIIFCDTTFHSFIMFDGDAHAIFGPCDFGLTAAVAA
jgi:hypothetical protein